MTQQNSDKQTCAGDAGVLNRPKDYASRNSRDQTEIREGSTSFVPKADKASPIIDTEKPVRQMNSVQTNEQYRTEILLACRSCFTTAAGRAQFCARMEGICSLVREISDTPAVDENFLQGVYFALLSVAGWGA